MPPLSAALYVLLSRSLGAIGSNPLIRPLRAIAARDSRNAGSRRAARETARKVSQAGPGRGH